MGPPGGPGQRRVDVTAAAYSEAEAQAQAATWASTTKNISPGPVLQEVQDLGDCSLPSEYSTRQGRLAWRL